MFGNDFSELATQQVWDAAAKKDDGNIQGVGIGIALKNGEIDLSRPEVLRLYVNKKRAKTSRAKRRPGFEIPRFFDVHAGLESVGGTDLHGRDLILPRVTFPTDVHEVGDLVGSGALTMISGDPSVVTAGAIVRWRVASNPSQLFWGIVTVAHGFDRGIDLGAAFDTRIRNPQTGAEFYGKRILQLKPPVKGFDTVLIRVSPVTLVSQQLLGSELQPSVPMVRFADLASLKGAGGAAFQFDRQISFYVAGPVDSLTFRGVGTVRQLVHVTSVPKAFVGTTSGSVYSIVWPKTGRLVPAALQIGSDTRTDFKEGYGQSLPEALLNFTEQMNRVLIGKNDRIIDSIELVATF